jgi:hypothetical protein
MTQPDQSMELNMMRFDQPRPSEPSALINCPLDSDISSVFAVAIGIDEELLLEGLVPDWHKVVVDFDNRNVSRV